MVKTWLTMFQTWLTMFKKQGWPCVDHGWTMVKHDSCRGILPPFWTWSTMNESLTMIIHVPKSHNDRGQTCLTMIPKTMVKHVLTKVVVYCRPWKQGQTCSTVCWPWSNMFWPNNCGCHKDHGQTCLYCGLLGLDKFGKVDGHQIF